MAIDGLSLTLAAGKIYGLLGRNGAGKTTPALGARRLPPGQRRPGARRRRGPVRERQPHAGTSASCGTGVDAQDTDRVATVLELARGAAAVLGPGVRRAADRAVRPAPAEKGVGLSRGMKSAAGIMIGLAARAPLTIFDESYLGLDAPSRYAFYDELLADYLAQPRTVILSTHLIEEVGPLFEEVVIIDRGRLVVHEETERCDRAGPASPGRPRRSTASSRGSPCSPSSGSAPPSRSTVFGPLGPEREPRRPHRSSSSWAGRPAGPLRPPHREATARPSVRTTDGGAPMTPTSARPRSAACPATPGPARSSRSVGCLLGHPGVGAGSAPRTLIYRVRDSSSTGVYTVVGQAPPK